MQDESGHASTDFIRRFLTNLAGARMDSKDKITED
jgi:hypothetical protein